MNVKSISFRVSDSCPLGGLLFWRSGEAAPLFEFGPATGGALDPREVADFTALMVGVRSVVTAWEEFGYDCIRDDRITVDLALIHHCRRTCESIPWYKPGWVRP